MRLHRGECYASLINETREDEWDEEGEEGGGIALSSWASLLLDSVFASR